MPQRNGQNPIKLQKKFGQDKNSGSASGGRSLSSNAAGHCPSCGAEVPPKPGFRLSSLKCPKCGASLGKK